VVSPQSGTGAHSVTVTIAQNTDTSARTATVVFKGANSGVTFSLTVTQQGKSGGNTPGDDTPGDNPGSTSIDKGDFDSDKQL
jgi:hypothetical protein